MNSEDRESTKDQIQTNHLKCSLLVESIEWISQIETMKSPFRGLTDIKIYGYYCCIQKT